MAHPRKLIRDAVVAALLGPHASDPSPTYATSAGARVEATRVPPWGRSELPAIAVFTPSETVDPESSTTAPRELTRKVEILVEGIVTGNGAIDDVADALALQIENAIHADPQLGGTAADCVLSSTDLAVEGEGKTLVGHIGLTYDVTYQTLAPEAPTDLDDLDSVDTVTKITTTLQPDDWPEDIVEDLET